MPEDEQTILKVILAVTALIIFLAGAIVSFVYAYRKKHSKHLAEKEDLQSQFEQELLRSQLEIQEQTFKTISQEIHDNIGQMLSLAKLNLNRIDTGALGNDTEKLNDAKKLISKSIQDLRDLSRTLNTDSISSIGLFKAIEIELHLLQKTGTVQTSFKIQGIPVRLDSQKELILFRIYQEALHNIIKHAAATNVLVIVTFEENKFELVINDNGRGFDSAVDSNLGSGIRNMKSRSKLIGANWSMISDSEHGTVIQITLPII